MCLKSLQDKQNEKVCKGKRKIDLWTYCLTMKNDVINVHFYHSCATIAMESIPPL